MMFVKYAFGAMLVFDVAYLFLMGGAEVCSSLWRKCTKKKKPDPITELLEEDDDYSEESFGTAPYLSADAIRMVPAYRYQELVTERIIPLCGDIEKQLSEKDKSYVTLLLTSFMKYLREQAPKYEQNFTILLTMLNACEPGKDPDIQDPIDRIMDDGIQKEYRSPDYYLDYQRYRLSCDNPVHIVTVCKTLILAVLKKLYGEWYTMSDELVDSPKDTLEHKLWDARIETEDFQKDIAMDAPWEVE